jgi:hypothetical protein
MEPNTREMSVEMATHLQHQVDLLANDRAAAPQCAAGANSCPETSTVDIPELHIMKKNSTRRHQIVLPPEQLLFFNLPTALPADAFALSHSSLAPTQRSNETDAGSTPIGSASGSDSDSSGGSVSGSVSGSVNAPVYRLRWDDNQAFGGITILDLSNHALVAYMRSLTLPKAYFLYSKTDKKAYTRMLSAVLPLTRKYMNKIKVYFCPYETCAEYTHKFGLEKKDLPRSVVDDPANGMKFTNTEGYRSLTYTRIERFWKQALNEMDPPEAAGSKKQEPDL